MREPDWQSEDGSIRLYLGDCLEVMPELTDTVDAVICDPPFGTTACAWDTVIPFAPLWEAYRRVIKPSGAIVLFGSQPFTSALVISNPKMFRYSLVWDKGTTTGFLDANRKPLRQHEDICVFYSKQPTYNPQKWTGKTNHARKPGGSGKAQYLKGSYNVNGSDISGQKFPTSICRFAKHSASEALHPTQKPVALLEYLIRTYTNEGETVLDSCAGSFSTAIACMRTGRKFIGIEQDAAYFATGEARVKAEKHQGRLFIL